MEKPITKESQKEVANPKEQAKEVVNSKEMASKDHGDRIRTTMAERANNSGGDQRRRWHGMR